MATITRDDVVEILGDVDDLFVERIVDTNATVSEIIEALDDLEDERWSLEARSVSLSPRVAAVRAIVEELLADEADDGAPYPDGVGAEL